MRAFPLASAAVALASSALVALAMPRADATRTGRVHDHALAFAPDGRTLAVAASGFEEPLADLVWVRTVLVFGERIDTGLGDAVPWLQRMLEAANALDPRWRTPYFYGGTLLRALGAVDESDEVFARGAAALPRDPFFPFSLGMNAYLYRDDAVTAAELVGRAAALPGAPSWYGAAAAAMHEDAGARGVGLRYLEEQLRDAEDPKVRASLEYQLGRLRHNALVARWEEACRAHAARTGRPLPSPEALRSLGFALPENPRGDAWIVGSDGVVRSEASEGERLRDLRRAEWALLRP